jgi:hypothetical protein
MPCLLALALVTTAQAQDGNQADRETAQAIRKLIPRAASMSLADCKVMALSDALPKVSDFESQPLTLVLFCISIKVAPERTKEERADFRVLQFAPKPSDLMKEMVPIGVDDDRPAPGFGSFLHADRIKEVTASVTGDVARGKVSFEAPELYAGTVQYFARQTDGKWNVTEFHLPAYGWSVVLDKEGRWTATQDAEKARAEFEAATRRPARNP